MHGVKLLSRLRLNSSHLNEHKVRHGFKDATNCMCDSGSATETTLHFHLLLYESKLHSFEIKREIIKLTIKFVK